MSQNLIIKCSIAFLLGIVVFFMIRGNGLSVGGITSPYPGCLKSDGTEREVLRPGLKCEGLSAVPNPANPWTANKTCDNYIEERVGKDNNAGWPGTHYYPCEKGWGEYCKRSNDACDVPGPPPPPPPRTTVEYKTCPGGTEREVLRPGLKCEGVSAVPNPANPWTANKTCDNYIEERVGKDNNAGWPGTHYYPCEKGWGEYCKRNKNACIHEP